MPVANDSDILDCADGTPPAQGVRSDVISSAGRMAPSRRIKLIPINSQDRLVEVISRMTIDLVNPTVNTLRKVKNAITIGTTAKSIQAMRKRFRLAIRVGLAAK